MINTPFTVRNGSTSQRGATLIELMVGLVIGLLVVLAATSTLIINRTSGNTISDSAALSMQANQAMRQISFALKQAGAFEVVPFTPSGSTTPNEVTFILGDLDKPAPRVLSGSNDVGSGAIKPDALTVYFTNRDTTVTRDCLGNSVSGLNAEISNAYTVASGDLRCNGNNPAQALANNVEDMQLLYLVMNGSSSQWFKANEVEAASAWNRVVAVDVCIQVRGDVNHGTLLADTFINCNNVETSNDKYMRLVMRQTVQLRNRFNNL